LAKIIDQRKDGFRRRRDAHRARHAQRIWLARREDQHGRDRERQNDGDDDNDFEHGIAPYSKNITA
jgi:hypothetical protein